MPGWAVETSIACTIICRPVHTLETLQDGGSLPTGALGSSFQVPASTTVRADPAAPADRVLAVAAVASETASPAAMARLVTGRARKDAMRGGWCVVIA